MALVLAAPSPSLPWAPLQQRCRRRSLFVATSALHADEFPRLDSGPVEPALPRFDRGPPSIERPPQAPRDRSKMWRPQRRRWRSYKATPRQAVTGALVGACCSIVSLKALSTSYDHISANPLAHDVPFGLTDNVNQAVLTMLLGFGFLGVSLFAVSGIGLALLAAKLIGARIDESRSSVASRMMAMVGMVAVCMIAGEASASPQVNARASDVFQRSCLGCHARGGNILQPGATLKAEDLERNGVSTVADIFRITYSGKGRMPGFGEACTPRGQCTFGPRLSDEDIQALAEFVKSQADQGWPAP